MRLGFFECRLHALLILTVAPWLHAADAGLRIEPASIELGRVVAGEIRELTFRLHNDTDQVISLDEVSSASSRVRFADFDRSIPAHGQIDVSATLTTRRGDLGRILRKIRVKYEERSATLPISMEMAAYQGWDISPATLELPASTKDESFTTEVIIQSRWHEIPTVETATVTGDWLEITAIEINPANASARLLIRKLPGDTVGALKSAVTIRLRGTDFEAELVVPVSASIYRQPFLIPEAPRAIVYRGEPTGTVTFEVHGINAGALHCITTDGVKITAMDPNPSGFTLTAVVPRENRERARFSLIRIMEGDVEKLIFPIEIIENP